jgi:nucleoside-diphosphate-sugar epimerase
MKVLITGANGFIGSALCNHMSAQGYKVIPVARQSGDFSDRLVIAASDDAKWREALKGCDSVVHLAARAHVMQETESNPQRAFRLANVEPTLALARVACAAGVRRIVFISSIGVNGNITLPGAKFTPDDIPAPHDAYAISKWEAEQGLRQIASETGLEFVIIRPPMVYGPGAKGSFATLCKLVNMKIPLPFGAVNNQRSIIALENLLSFIALCANRAASPQAANQVFLISDDAPVSTTQLIRHIAMANGREARLIPVPPNLLRFFARFFDKAGLADRLLGSLVIDNSKARDLLNWQQAVRIEEELRKISYATFV